MGYYYPMSLPAQVVNLDCVRGQQQGGFTYVGSRSNLILTLYAPGSEFDEAIQQWLGGCEVTATAEHAATAASEDLPGSCSKDNDDDFWDFLSDIEDLSETGDPSSSEQREPAAPVTPAPPMCGDSCWGPVNLCGALDGCRCIADLFQGVGSRYYTGTCKPSHFAFDGRRLSEVLVEGQDSLNTTATNFALTPNNGSAAWSVATVTLSKFNEDLVTISEWIDHLCVMK
ncbi:hypothetical protein MMC28_000557 [Mycoblastus sanguinarius]|nr:hypothetical protein [Mycoblastus sanguinarius]